MGSIFTNQRGSAWQCFVGHRLSMGKNALSTCRSREIIEYFGTKFGKRDILHWIYKPTKFVEDRLIVGAATWQ